MYLHGAGVNSPVSNHQSSAAVGRPPRGSGEPAVLVAPGTFEEALLQPQPSGWHPKAGTAAAVAARAPTNTGTALHTVVAAQTNVPMSDIAHSALDRLTALAGNMSSIDAQPHAIMMEPFTGSGMLAAYQDAGLAADRGQLAGSSSGVNAILASAAALTELAGQSPEFLAKSEHQGDNGHAGMTQPMHGLPLLSPASAALATDQSDIALGVVYNRPAAETGAMLSYSTVPVMQHSANPECSTGNGLPTSYAQSSQYLDRGHMGAASAVRMQSAGVAAAGQQQPGGPAASSITPWGFRPADLHAGTGVASPGMSSVGQSIDFSKVRAANALIAVVGCSDA